MNEGRAGQARHQPGTSGNGDFQAAVARLERAVHDLVRMAREQFSDRAAGFIDDTTARLEEELTRRRGTAGGSRYGHYSRRSRSWSGAHGTRRAARVDRWRSRRLYRDPEREKIVGVCAGIARYYGVEPWVVRCIAVTGLLFFPSIVFPAYWIMYFVMDKPPKGERSLDRGEDRSGEDPSAPTMRPRPSPRYRLRDVQADLTEVELRLRRMETHVTSGQYELQRELNRIENGSDGPRG